MTVVIFDVPARTQNLLVRKVFAAAPVGAKRVPPARSTSKPGFRLTWPEMSALLHSIC